jgi:phosphoribosylanthranilate isomerase
MIKIKICGITREREVDALNAALPDYAGFVFAPESRRYITPEAASDLRSKIDEHIVTVGVFKDADPLFIADLVLSGIIGAVQLHGAEDGDYAAELKRLPVPVIKAVRVDDENSFGDFPADFLLFDNGAGGTGESFGLELLDRARDAGIMTKRPFFIAGGIGLDTIGGALKRRPYGIDVSSGVETGGVKDGAKIHELVRAVRNYEG